MIFVDATFIIAIASDIDQWHERAVEILPKIKKEKRITSELIISEIVTLVGALHGGKSALKIYNYIKDNYIIYKDDKLLDESMLELLKYDGTLSLADSSALTIMKKLNIHEIASFDDDFDNKDHVVRIH
ncbi:type II toxin-antitoxin system VapC family toxin [Methanobrevibacter filiformis]|uniref:tRNA(FMet)-specific endonuclease VapC n=1 Tax=Methanobrevibacter filiformis TaxID=55758 RepID=A0A166CW47_9EURY|nr:PIN domain-containing protein [Methanobrevibacter filiformis]KZX17217.1 tRNA(fMet)-specific endonuclease VapC [Methanobrevibacter filiformis]